MLVEPNSDELKKLKTDLEEVIQLTEGLVESSADQQQQTSAKEEQAANAAAQQKIKWKVSFSLRNMQLFLI